MDEAWHNKLACHNKHAYRTERAPCVRNSLAPSPWYPSPSFPSIFSTLPYPPFLNSLISTQSHFCAVAFLASRTTPFPSLYLPPPTYPPIGPTSSRFLPPPPRNPATTPLTLLLSLSLPRICLQLPHQLPAHQVLRLLGPIHHAQRLGTVARGQLPIPPGTRVTPSAVWPGFQKLRSSFQCSAWVTQAQCHVRSLGECRLEDESGGSECGLDMGENQGGGFRYGADGERDGGD